VDGQMKLAHAEENVPAGMQKMKQYGISSAIIEIDVDYTKTVPMSKFVEVFLFLLLEPMPTFKHGRIPMKVADTSW